MLDFLDDLMKLLLFLAILEDSVLALVDFVELDVVRVVELLHCLLNAVQLAGEEAAIVGIYGDGRPSSKSVTAFHYILIEFVDIVCLLSSII